MRSLDCPGSNFATDYFRQHRGVAPTTATVNDGNVTQAFRFEVPFARNVVALESKVERMLAQCKALKLLPNEATEV